MTGRNLLLPACFLLVEQLALGQVHDERVYGDNSISVASITTFKFNGHLLRCRPNSADSGVPRISVGCRQRDTEDHPTFFLEFTTGQLPSSWNRESLVDVGYRFDRGQRIVSSAFSTRWSGEVSGKKGEEAFDVGTNNLPTIRHFLDEIVSAKMVNFWIAVSADNTSEVMAIPEEIQAFVLLPEQIAEAVSDFEARCSEFRTNEDINRIIYRGLAESTESQVPQEELPAPKSQTKEAKPALPGLTLDDYMPEVQAALKGVPNAPIGQVSYRTRYCDLLTDTHACTVAFAEDWRDTLAIARTYLMAIDFEAFRGKRTPERKIGIILIVRDPSHRKYVTELQTTIKWDRILYPFDVFVYEVKRPQ